VLQRIRMNPFFIGKNIPLWPHLSAIFDNSEKLPTFLTNWQLTFMGRDALRLVGNVLNLAEKKVLFPCYCCIEAVSPFLDSNLCFYDVELPGFHIPIDELIDKISHEQISAIVVIDYFGQVESRLPELYEACKEYNVVLIEDCAQSLLSNGVGNFCHVATTSLRKLMPCPDGGAFKINATDLKPIFKSVKMKRGVVNDIAALLIIIIDVLHLEELNLNRGHFEKIFPFLKRMKQKTRSVMKPSHFCERMLTRVNPDVICTARRERWLFWKDQLKTLDVKFAMPTLADNVCPLGFPILFGSKNIRDNILKFMSKRDIHLKVHWPVPNFIPSGFTTPLKMADRSVTLPVFPELSWAKMKHISNLLKEALNKVV